MSADSQRLKSALRRIVLESPELRELLGDSDNRGDQAGSAGVGTSEAEESRLCCDGSTSDNANPGTDERDPDADGAGQNGLDTDDPADLTSGDGTLSGVTDCSTGEPVCFDGSGFIPPDGWDEPYDPPIVDDYVEGQYVIGRATFGGPGSIGSSPGYSSYVKYQSCSLALADLQPYCPNFDMQCAGASGGTFNCFGEGGGNFEYSIKIKSCSSDYDPICDEPPPSAEEWPSDGCVNLAIVNGSIVGSKYDPENSSGSYSAPMDEIQLCSGGEQIGLKPASNGGWKTINATTDSGYLWDSHGNKIAHIDGNEYSDPDV